MKYAKNDRKDRYRVFCERCGRSLIEETRQVGINSRIEFKGGVGAHREMNFRKTTAVEAAARADSAEAPAVDVVADEKKNANAEAATTAVKDLPLVDRNR